MFRPCGMVALLSLAFLSLFGSGFSEFTTDRLYQKHYQEYPDHFVDPIPVTEPDVEHYYAHAHTHPAVHRFRPPPSEKGLDMTSLGILAIIKLLLLKIKGMGLIFLLLLKLPALLFTFFGKFLFLFKVAKVLKLLALPFLLLGLLPLLLGPLLLLAPLLLPLLLALPIPVLQPAANQPAAGRRRRDLGNLQFLQSLLESEKCLERIACVLAADKDPSYTSTVVWGLERLTSLIPHQKISNYVIAYRDAASNRFSTGKCYRKYPCQRLAAEKKSPSTLTHQEKNLNA